MFEFERISYLEPVQCCTELVSRLQGSAEELNLDYATMPSGAAHDAQIIGSLIPVGMIFVPSKNGQSHSPAEWTAWSDIEDGANLLLRTVLTMLCQNSQNPVANGF